MGYFAMPPGTGQTLANNRSCCQRTIDESKFLKLIPSNFDSYCSNCATSVSGDTPIAAQRQDNFLPFLVYLKRILISESVNGCLGS
jgi:hypothetical protein